MIRFAHAGSAACLGGVNAFLRKCTLGAARGRGGRVEWSRKRYLVHFIRLSLACISFCNHSIAYQIQAVLRARVHDLT